MIIPIGQQLRITALLSALPVAVLCCALRRKGCSLQLCPTPTPTPKSLEYAKGVPSKVRRGLAVQLV